MAFHRTRLLSLLAALLVSAAPAWARAPQALVPQAQAEETLASSLLHRAPAQVAEIAPGVVLPLWRGHNGRLLAIVASGPARDAAVGRAPMLGSALSLRAVDASPLLTETLRYQFDNGVRADARVAQRSLLAPACSGRVGSGACSGMVALGGVTSAAVGAGFARGPVSFALSLGLSQPSGLAAPMAAQSLSPTYGAGAINGLPLDFLGNSARLDASSGLQWRGLRFELGASYGQINTNPVLVPGVDGLNEKSLRLGIGRGDIMGVVTGRVITPGAAAGLGLANNSSWTTVDLGITWRLPWHGAFSVGAQNLWSQGGSQPGATAPSATARVPYIQYQQDL